MSTVIKVENLSKQYRLGDVGTGTLSHDLKRWWYKARGKEDPYLQIGEVNDRSTKGESDYVWALKDINFEVKAGEVLGIIGRNGAGKSTLLKILSKTTAPTTGRVKVKGRIASLLEVGTGFHPELSGRENIFLNGAILGMTKQEIKSKFDEIVDFSGVERYIDTPVKRYSSGMYVRLAFAVAAHLEPEILIVDEVLAVGDAEFQKKCLGKMKDVSVNEGRTVLFVSHNMAAIENLCSNGILLMNSKIHISGDTKLVIKKYLESNSNTKHGELNILYRQGNNELRFTKVEILDSLKNKEYNVRSGDDIFIRLFYSQNNIEYKNVLLGVGINNDLDQRLSFISNEIIDLKLDLEKKETNYIDINISKFPFTIGIYSLTLFISINGIVADWIPNAFYFEVFEGDFYKSGKIVQSINGNTLLDFNITQ